MGDASPTIRRRELGARLRALRSAANLTVDDVAIAIEVSASKVSRLETGSRGANVNDIRVLCDLYRISPEQRDELLMLAREGRRRSWYQDADLPEGVETFVGMEQAALSIQYYTTSIVPPLLQTEAYARAVTSGAGPWLTEEQVEHVVSTRLKRQEVLTSEGSPHMSAVVDEGALRRLVGGVEVMRQQVRALIDSTRRSAKTTVRVIGMEAGAHGGMDSAFTILQLRELTDVVYVEGLMGYFLLRKADQVARYREVFEQLRAVALDPDASRDRLHAVLAALQD